VWEEKPLVIGIFRNRLRENAAGYPATAERMEELVSKLPGFLGIKTFRADDGERVSLFAFESLAALEAWREHPEHRVAQRRGRDEFYAEYTLQICQPLRTARFEAVD
jgi:heme-degrading monooxygenase HmoA